MTRLQRYRVSRFLFIDSVRLFYNALVKNLNQLKRESTVRTSNYSETFCPQKTYDFEAIKILTLNKSVIAVVIFIYLFEVRHLSGIFL